MFSDMLHIQLKKTGQQELSSLFRSLVHLLMYYLVLLSIPLMINQLLMCQEPTKSVLLKGCGLKDRDDAWLGTLIQVLQHYKM